MPRSIILLLNVVQNRPFHTNMAAFQCMTLNETRSHVKYKQYIFPACVQHTEPILTLPLFSGWLICRKIGNKSL